MFEKDGETHCRPVFNLSEIFIRNYHIKRKRTHQLILAGLLGPAPQLTPVEEINYSQIAIKYSPNLTKDMIFSGLRSIIRQIGEYLRRGEELEINFTFGKLIGKNYRVKFLFNMNRLLEIIPENLEPGVFSKTDKPLKYYVNNETENHFDETLSETIDPQASQPKLGKQRPSTSSSSSARPNLPPIFPINNNTNNNSFEFTLTNDNSSESNVPSSAPALLHSSSDFNSSNQFPSKNIPSLDIRPSTSPVDYNSYEDHQHYNNFSYEEHSDQSEHEYEESSHNSEPNMNAVRSMLDTLDPTNPANKPNHSTFKLPDSFDFSSLVKPSKNELKRIARERVQAQALERALNDTMNQAKEEELQNLLLNQNIENENNLLKEQRELNIIKKKKYASLLQQQQEDNLKMKNEIKQNEKNQVPACLINSIDKTLNKEDKFKLAQTNLNELKLKEEKKLAEKLAEKSIEQNNIKKQQDLYEFLKLKERANHLKNQQDLLQAWERDSHLTNLKKLQYHGASLVNEYIQKNIADISSNSLSNSFNSLSDSQLGSNNKPTLGQAFTSSIGYDPRKGRI